VDYQKGREKGTIVDAEIERTEVEQKGCRRLRGVSCRGWGWGVSRDKAKTMGVLLSVLSFRNIYRRF
jgi:hypothetical protein